MIRDYEISELRFMKAIKKYRDIDNKGGLAVNGGSHLKHQEGF
jgi:hypothetical protein